MSLENIFFLDIETVPEIAPDVLISPGELFIKKFKKEIDPYRPIDGFGIVNNKIRDEFERNLKAIYYEKAGLTAEFGKIVCVSIGKLSGKTFFVKSMVGREEPIILQKLSETLETGGARIFGGHNIKEFDLPMLFRRYIINNLTVPSILDFSSKKPWEIPHVDTMQLWGNTQWNYKISLDLLCHVLNVQSSKSKITGGDVSEVFYSNDDDSLLKISEYCASDVVASANCYCRIKGLDLLLDENIKYV